MAIRERGKRKPQIDLSGPDGNAFALLGNAFVLATRYGLDGEAIIREMEAGDYENLIAVFDRHFGKYVDLIR